MNDDHERLRVLLAGYVLGGLSPAERAEVDQHLEGCASCREELADIEPAAAALAELRPHAGDNSALEAPRAPSALGPRVVGSVEDDVRRARRRRSLRAAGLTAVAAAVAALVVVVGIRELGPKSPPVAAIPLEKVQVSGSTNAVRASAAIVPHTWGVEVKLHARGFVRGERYVVLVQADDGSDHEAGEFVGTGSKEMDCNLSSSVLRSQARGFEVLDAAGDVLLTSRF